MSMTNIRLPRPCTDVTFIHAPISLNVRVTASSTWKRLMAGFMSGQRTTVERGRRANPDRRLPRHRSPHHNLTHLTQWTSLHPFLESLVPPMIIMELTRALTRLLDQPVRLRRLHHIPIAGLPMALSMDSETHLVVPIPTSISTTFPRLLVHLIPSIIRLRATAFVDPRSTLPLFRPSTRLSVLRTKSLHLTTSIGQTWIMTLRPIMFKW